MKNDGGPAFLGTGDFGPNVGRGMTLRDWFAGKAIQGFLSQSHAGQGDWRNAGFGWGEDCANSLNKHSKTVATTLADFAYQVADAMLAKRTKSQED